MNPSNIPVNMPKLLNVISNETKLRGHTMKTTIFSLLILTSSLFAQGMGQHRQFYDSTTVTKINGTIASVDSQENPRGGFFMVRLSVQDTGGTTPIMVGPSSYLDEQNISFRKGDSIQVTGSKVNFRGKDVMIAGRIVTAGKTIKLRDDSGKPVWSNGMR